jgi:hypothetical protein
MTGMKVGRGVGEEERGGNTDDDCPGGKAEGDGRREEEEGRGRAGEGDVDRREADSSAEMKGGSESVFVEEGGGRGGGVREARDTCVMPMRRGFSGFFGVGIV